MQRLGVLAAPTLLLSCLSTLAFAADDSYLGAFGSPGEELVVVTRWDDDHYLLDMNDGTARRLAPLEDGRFAYGPTRSATEPVMGHVRFLRDGTGRIEALQEERRSPLPRIALSLEAVEFANGDEAHLAGTLVGPPTKPLAWTLWLNGEGPNVRQDGWDVAAWLAAHGIGVLLFDQRGAGDSTGEAVKGTYHRRSMAAAADAVAAMRFLLARPETAGVPVGVAGRSQGGWLGAIVAREVPGTAFYVNLAGNGSPGWAQWRHAMSTWLHRHGVPEPEIERADTYFDAFFGVYHGRVEWGAYRAALARARGEAWWEVMKRRYVAEWESLEEAQDYARAESVNVPADDFRRVRAPALGLFFEHDHSTTPETPHQFLEALLEGGNGDVTVRVYPGADHGAWVLDGYRADRSRITRRLTEPFALLRDWILDQAEAGAGPPR